MTLRNPLFIDTTSSILAILKIKMVTYQTYRKKYHMYALPNKICPRNPDKLKSDVSESGQMVFTR
jgi:hypothetical protein